MNNNFLLAQEIQIEAKYYTTENGLPYRSIRHITQDSIGFIWLATEKGICKFNGYNFENYNQNQGLRSTDIKSIHCISNEIIWIVYNNFDKNHIDVFNTKTHTSSPFNIYYKNKLNLLLLSKMNRVIEGKNGIFFIALKDTSGYLTFSTISDFKYHPTLNEVLPLYANEQNYLFTYEFKRKKILEFNHQKNKATVNNNYQEVLNWLEFNPYYYTSQYFSFSERINSIEIKKKILKKEFSKQFHTDYFTTLLNEKYLVNDYKIYDLNSKKELLNFLEIDPRVVKPYNPILSKFKDKSGNLWLGLEFGLIQTKIQVKKFNNSLNNIVESGRTIAVRGIIESDTNNILINTENYKQYQINLKQNSKNNIAKSVNISEVCYAFCKDANGNIFYHNSSKKELIKIDKKTGKETIYNFNKIGRIWSLASIDINTIWAGTELDGIFKINLESKTVTPIAYNNFNELSKSIIYQIKKIDENNFWVCSNSGLYKASKTNGIIERFSTDNKERNYLPTNNIAFIENEDNKNFWIATLDKGLLLYNLEKGFLKAFAKSEGLSSETIYAAYKDGNNSLWIPSNNGIIQFNTQRKEVIRIYGASDGITNVEFNRIAHYRTTDSTLVFGSLNGITYFNPKNFYIDYISIKANLAIENATVYNGNTGTFSSVVNTLNTTKTITLNAYDRFISFELAFLNFDKVEENIYAYKIDDNDWILQSNRTIQIAGLSWGNHTVSIKARDKNGVWGSNIFTINLLQLKPFYLQTWFIVLLIFLTISIFILIYKTRINQLSKQEKILQQKVEKGTFALSQSNIKLEGLVQQKEVLLKEIHHRVKNNLAIISGLLELQSDNTNDLNAKNTLLEGTNRVRSIALIHQKLYQNEEFATIELKEFVDDLYKQIASVLASNAQTIFFENKLPSIFLDIDTSIPLGLILNELITNSFKYAFTNNNNPTINLEFEIIDSENYKLIYKDNGKGLPTNYNITKANTLGIRLINKLAKQLSGKLHYQRNEDLSIFTITFKTLEARNKE